ncbi:MAG: 1-deoxy-D-xylulose-5-phosphate reductoisomerase [Lachnospiraceae bacterium]|nr:1-deoxy-D-xylulose-5-phosphate reductoisomerase [Lachnospiraceae bacterium]
MGGAAVSTKRVAILGSTGSIGTQALDVIRAQEDLEVCALAAGRNIDLLEKQAREFRPEVAVLWDDADAAELQRRLAGTGVTVLSGMEGLTAAATLPSADTVLAAVVGMMGIRPVMAAIRAGKEIALANKETLVTAGHLIMPLVREKGVTLYPVDSEHSAIFQCLRGENPARVRKILLTASGGPFRGYTREQLEQVTVADALRHPNWSMGKKITIDSSTMVNKGLEVMEAAHLFSVPVEKIEVVVQPKSIIHSMVEYEDGAVIAQLGTPDMKLPIQYALLGTDRRPLPGPGLDFAALRSITFEKPDFAVFRGLALGYEAGAAGGTLPTVYNAANEWAVAAFLSGRIRYTQITDIIEEEMQAHENRPAPDLDLILETEAAVRSRLEKRYHA